MQSLFFCYFKESFLTEFQLSMVIPNFYNSPHPNPNPHSPAPPTHLLFTSSEMSEGLRFHFI